MVRISNINTLRQQTINAVTAKKLKFFMGLPVDTRISIPETEFEITQMRFHWLQILQPEPNTYCLKRTSSYWNTKKSEANYYPSLSLTGGYNFIGQGPEMPWFKKPSDGVYWSDFASVGFNLHIPHIGTKQE
jgi:hypothetical protein